MGVLVIRTKNHRIALWKGWLQDEFPYAEVNPKIWFAKDLDTQDIVACEGTRLEAVAAIEEYIDDKVDI